MVHSLSQRPSSQKCAARLFMGLVAACLAALCQPARADGTSASLDAMKAGYQRPAKVPYPHDNPPSEAKADLGYKLFFDPRLSGSSTMSCASCHDPALSWGDGLPTAIGAARLSRRSPTILNLAWAEAMFWDGRAYTLEQQAVGPIQAPDGMNQSMPRLVSLLNAIPGYRDAFRTAFPNEPISATTIAKAIATFERAIVSGEAPFDRWIKGDETAIPEAAKRGFVTFNTRGHCASCHSTWRFSDDSFHDIGLPGNDPGRGAVIAGVEPLRQAFKTPGLRNVAERGPYMHNGSIQTLAAVIRHYDHGFTRRSSLSAEIYRLNLTDQEADDLVVFLKTLSSVDAKIAVPVLPVMETR